MNERIKELSVIAKNLTTDDAIHLSRIHNRTLSLDELEEIFAEKFAELIVRECIYTLQLKIVRNGNTPENLRSREHIRDLGEKFGIEFPMDYYPDRNKHFGVES
jgi:hypothetical protein